MYAEELAKAVAACPQSSDIEIAARFADALDEESRLAWFLSIAAREVALHRRTVTRSIEVQAFAALYEGTGQLDANAEPTLTISEVFRERFALGNGIRVEWGAATVEQHRQRISMLQTLQAGIGVTIHRHEQAITLIEDANVSCLDDLVEHEDDHPLLLHDVAR